MTKQKKKPNKPASKSKATAKRTLKPKPPSAIKSKPVSAAKPAPKSGTISELAASRGVSRTVVNRALEVGALDSELFPLKGRHRTVPDFASAGAALDEFLKTPTKLGRPGSAIDMSGVDFSDPATWPRDGDALEVIKGYWTAHRAMREDKLAESHYLRADAVRRINAEGFRIEREHLRRLPDECAKAIASALGVDNADCVRERLSVDIERILAEHEASLPGILEPTRE